MSKITAQLNSLRDRWETPREAIHRGRTCPFLLTCTFSPEAANSLEIFPFEIPEDIREFWRYSSNATLFKDQKYGQWGIEILSPTEALLETSKQIANRPRDFEISDLVFARFFGDSDLLVIQCDSKKPDFGSVSVALPIDRRKDWPVPAKSFGGFLDKLIETQGEKYWSN